MSPRGKKTRGKTGYMISAVAEMYSIHPQTLRLYEREGLLAPSRSDGNTRLYTEGDLERLELILNLTRDPVRGLGFWSGLSGRSRRSRDPRGKTNDRQDHPGLHTPIV